MNEFMQQFLLESRELVEQAISDLLTLEENPGDAERLDSAFRAFHTLKGSAGIVDFAAMGKAAHAAEDVLGLVRSGKAALSRSFVNNCLMCLNLIVQWLDAIQLDDQIPPDADQEANAIVETFGSIDPIGEASLGILKTEQVRAGNLSQAARTLLEAQVELLNQDDPDGLIALLLSAGRVAANVLRSLGRSEEIASLERAAGEAAAAESSLPLLVALQELLDVGKPQIAKADAPLPQDTSARVLRVDVERIDTLVKLMGEFTVAKNAIGHLTQLADEGAASKALAQQLKEQHALLGRLTEDLQQSVLSIRVLPLGHVFNRFPYLVREIAETMGKQVRLVTHGNETEADKVVVESLFESLLHIIRNALDHGIERADARAAAGKPQAATIHLRAARSGNVVIVEVEDDGRGIDIEKIRRLAVERGLVDAEHAPEMSEEEVADLVFAAGFSTAERITDLSGRGVGMNVVRTNVERLGGSARIASRPGLGTVVTLKLPFSVMMTRIMTVETGGQMFGIAIDSVVETVRIARAQISDIGAAKAFILRGRTIPLINLGQSLGHVSKANMSEHTNIVVISVADMLGGIEIDRFGDRLDVMLKPMDGLLQGMPGVAGTSLMGDGRVLIILDLLDLVQ